MRAMLLDGPRRPLRSADVPVPRPGPGQLLLRVRACGVCRTDLHVMDGELKRPKLPLILGHQIVATVEERGPGAGAARHEARSRVGVPWLGWTCGECTYCRSGRENLCPRARSAGARCGWPETASVSGSTASAPPRTSSPRSRAIKAGACLRSCARATRTTALRARDGRGVGGRVERSPARSARCRDRLRPRRRAGAPRAARGRTDDSWCCFAPLPGIPPPSPGDVQGPCYKRVCRTISSLP